MNARDFALIELDRRSLPGWPANQMRGDRGGQARGPEDPRDVALADQLVNGTLKNLLLLQHVMGHYAKRPLKKIDPLVQKILALGLYQIRFLTRVPGSAAVNEAVGQARRFGRASAAGFVNAVLRSAVRSPEVPMPDESKDAAGYAEVVLSHPREVFGRMAALAGVGGALSLARHDNEEPPTVVRLAPGVAAEEIAVEGVTLRAHSEGTNLFVIEGAKQAVLAELAARGVAQVQDPTAAKVVSYLELREGQTVLDRCAGLGTKTLQMREVVGAGGKILAVDPNVPRCKRLAQLLAKRGVENVHIEPVGMLADVKTPLPKFDRVLVDAPCSNSGTLARRPEARYFQGEKGMASLRDLQLRILRDTAGYVAGGGVMVYSTCSIWPEENEGMVATFLEGHGEFELVTEESTLPSGAGVAATAYHDGGYLAVLRRGQ